MSLTLVTKNKHRDIISNFLNARQKILEKLFELCFYQTNFINFKCLSTYSLKIGMTDKKEQWQSWNIENQRETCNYFSNF